MEMKLELVPVPVTDVDRAKAFYIQKAGFVEDVGGGVKYASFSDPDGNTLTLQEMAWRTGDS